MEKASVVAAMTRFMTKLGLPTSSFEFYHDGRQFLQEQFPFSLPEYLTIYADRLNAQLRFPPHEHSALRIAAALCAPGHAPGPHQLFEEFREAMRTVWLRAIPGHFDMILDLAECYVFGVWLISYNGETVFFCPAPLMKFEGGRLHNDTGPALWWNDGPEFYFLRGVQVDAKLIRAPESVTAQDVLTLDNDEVRRVWIEALGTRVIELFQPQLLHKDHTGELFRLLNASSRGDRPFIVVRVTDPSTGRQYLKRVPPTIRTAKEAVAWTFDMPEHLWNLSKET